MALFVQKFGGSSVADVDNIQKVAQLIAKYRAQGHQIIAVVSAMLGETDRLIELAHKISDEQPREHDALIATGEQVSAALLSMALNQLNVPAASLTGAQVGIYTTSQHKRAEIINVESEPLQKLLGKGIVPVVAGFQGVNENGEITTLGRGGSDLTAVAIAGALNADECQIFKDVEGVYTADPKVVPKAQCLAQITGEEMLELASQGAKVLQHRCLAFAVKHKVPLRVLSNQEKGEGTLISFNGNHHEQFAVSGITCDKNQAKLTMQSIPNRPGLASYILSAIGDAHLHVDMIVQNLPAPDNTIDFSFTVPRDDYKEALKITQRVAQELNAREVVGSEQVAKLSLVGVGMRTQPAIAALMFSALGREGIELHLIMASEIKISVIVDAKLVEIGVRALHSAFGLDRF